MRRRISGLQSTAFVIFLVSCTTNNTAIENLRSAANGLGGAFRISSEGPVVHWTIIDVHEYESQVFARYAYEYHENQKLAPVFCNGTFEIMKDEIAGASIEKLAELLREKIVSSVSLGFPGDQ